MNNNIEKLRIFTVFLSDVRRGTLLKRQKGSEGCVFVHRTNQAQQLHRCDELWSEGCYVARKWIRNTYVMRHTQQLFFSNCMHITLWYKKNFGKAFSWRCAAHCLLKTLRHRRNCCTRNNTRTLWSIFLVCGTKFTVVSSRCPQVSLSK